MKKHLLFLTALGVAGGIFASDLSAATRSTSYDYYWINADFDDPIVRDDRYVDYIIFSSLSAGDQEMYVPMLDNLLFFQDLTTTGEFFYAKPGETIYAELGYNAAWMHSYLYIDYDNDGEFYADINSDGTPIAGCDLVSYNAFNDNDNMDWVNSLGEPSEGGLSAPGVLPEFTIPADLAPGAYRMRFKLDWNSIDPAGNDDPNNYIINNGGVIIDTMLIVYTDETNVIDNVTGGTVTNGEGDELTTVPSDQSITLVVVPESGYELGDVELRAGFNTDKDVENEYGNPQYTTLSVPASKLAEGYTVPAYLLRGDLAVCGEMVKSSAIKAIQSAEEDGETVIYNLNGQKVTDPQSGIYIIKGQKKVVK